MESPSSTLTFAQMAVVLGYLNPQAVPAIEHQCQQLAAAGRPASFGDVAGQMQALNAAQIKQIDDLRRQGYFYCSHCPQLFPLPPHMKEGSSEAAFSCPNCRRPIYRQESAFSVAEPVTVAHSEDGTSETLALPGPETEELGQTLRTLPHQGSFTVKKVLGQGGFGKVYQAQDPLLKRTVALKMLKKEKGKNLLTRRRFHREILVTSRLEHPNIISVYEGGQLDEDALYFAMKEISGGTLKDQLSALGQKRRASLAEYLDIFLKVCDAMSYAHSRGVIHRDLKPSNIAVGDFGEVIVMDWGLAKLVGEREEISPEEDISDSELDGELSLAGSMLGTPGYMSPEQARGERETLGPTSDVYSLGAILYQILTLKLPFSGSARAILSQLLLNDPTPPEEASPRLEIPAELSAIAMKALAQRAEDRYATVADLKQDIVRYREGFSVSAKKDTALQAFTKWMRRNKTIAGAVLTVGATGVIFLAIWLNTLQAKLQTELSLSALQKQEKGLKDSIAEFQLERDQLEKKSQILRERAKKLRKQTQKLSRKNKELEQHNQNSRKVEQFRALLSASSHSLQKGDFAGASNYYQRMLKLNYRLALTHCLIAMLYQRQGKPRQALAYYHKIVKLKLRSPVQTHSMIGLSIQLKDYPTALRQIGFFLGMHGKGLKGWKNNAYLADVYLYHGQVHLIKKRLPAAEKAFLKGVQFIRTRNIDRSRLAGYFCLLGNVYRAKKQYPQARGYYQKVLKLRATGKTQVYHRYARAQLQRLPK